MNVESGPPEAPLPRNVGLLFFNDDPGHFFPATPIDVVYFPEGAGGDQFEEKVFVGPLSQVTRDAISFVERNYLKETVIKHPNPPEAERFWSFPLAANGSPPPEFETDEDRSYFLIRLPVHERVLASPEDAGHGAQVPPQVTGEVRRLLEALTGEMRRRELQAALGLKHEDHFRHAYLVPVLDAGLIEMTIPSKPRSSKQKYRLTDEGQRWLIEQGGTH